jgi:hypothetical protein
MLLQHSRTALRQDGQRFRELDIVEDIPEVALVAVTLPGRLTRRTAAFRDYCSEALTPSTRSAFSL